MWASTEQKALNWFSPTSSTVQVSNAGCTGKKYSHSLEVVFNNNWVRPVFLLQANTTEWTPFLLTTHAATVAIGWDMNGECRATWHAVLLHSKQACNSHHQLVIFINLQHDSCFWQSVRGFTRQNQARSCQRMTFFWQSLVSERQDSISSRWMRYEHTRQHGLIESCWWAVVNECLLASTAAPTFSSVSILCFNSRFSVRSR